MVKARSDKASTEAKRIMLKRTIPHLGDWMDRLDGLTKSTDEKTAVSALRTGLNLTKALMDDDDGTMDSPEIWDALDKLENKTGEIDSTPIPPAFHDIDADPDEDPTE